MKNLFFLIFFFGAFSPIYAQKALTFDEYHKTHKTTQTLDSLYPGAIDANPEKGIFKGRQDAFINAYKDMLMKFNDFLKNKKFIWGSTSVRCFNRIYFNAEGKIDYFLYNFPKGVLTAEQEQLFDKYLNEFIKDFQFSLTPAGKFAQCSPVVYGDAK